VFGLHPPRVRTFCRGGCRQPWIASPQALLEAIRSSNASRSFLGYSLRELGLLTNDQLYRALGGQPANVALGEMLVVGHDQAGRPADRARSQDGLPAVDLTRFPSILQRSRSCHVMSPCDTGRCH
jgi:hypothetical protein